MATDINPKRSRIKTDNVRRLINAIKISVDPLLAGTLIDQEPLTHRGGPVAFSMSYYLLDTGHIPEPEIKRNLPKSCRSIACIGGFCEILMHPAALYKIFPRMDPIMEFLGVTEQQAKAIVFAKQLRGRTDGQLSKIKPEQAIAMLENLIITGKVKWPSLIRS